MIWLLQALGVFSAMVAVDFAWTKYMLEAAAKRPHPAAAWSAAIVALGVVSVASYTQNIWLAIPAVAGAYVGTWVAVWRERAKAA